MTFHKSVVFGGAGSTSAYIYELEAKIKKLEEKCDTCWHKYRPKKLFVEDEGKEEHYCPVCKQGDTCHCGEYPQQEDE